MSFLSLTSGGLRIFVRDRDVRAPIVLQVSQGGSAYFAGKGLANDKQQASILGVISAALHIWNVAKAYGVYVRIFWTIRRVD